MFVIRDRVPGAAATRARTRTEVIVSSVSSRSVKTYVGDESLGPSYETPRMISPTGQMVRAGLKLDRPHVHDRTAVAVAVDDARRVLVVLEDRHNSRIVARVETGRIEGETEIAAVGIDQQRIGADISRARIRAVALDITVACRRLTGRPPGLGVDARFRRAVFPQMMQLANVEGVSALYTAPPRMPQYCRRSCS